MKTYQFNEQEADMIRDGLLAMMENLNKAFCLVKSDEAKKAVNAEWERCKALLDRLCSDHEEA